ncbi:hypothetical protein GEMRC1_007634 [Eukaryota sp. GEM-RC1]
MSDIEPALALRQLLPSNFYDSEFIRVWFARIKPPRNLEDTSKNPSITSKCHDSASAYDYFIKLLETRSEIYSVNLTEVNEYAASMLQHDMSVTFNKEKVPESSKISSTFQLNLFLQLHTLSHFAISNPSILDSLLDTFSSVILPRSVDSSNECSLTWFKIMQNLSNLYLKDFSLSPPLYNQALSLISRIPFTTGSVLCSLSFIASCLSIPTPNSFSISPTIPSIDIGSLYSDLASHPSTTPEPPSLSLNDSSTTWVTFNPVAYPANLDCHRIAATSKAAVGYGYLYVVDAVGISQIGLGNGSSMRGQLHNQITWKELNSNHVDGYGGHIAVSKYTVVVCSPQRPELILLDSFSLKVINRITNPFHNQDVCFFADESQLNIVKREDVEGQSVFKFGSFTVDSLVSNHVDITWKTFPSNQSTFLSSFVKDSSLGLLTFINTGSFFNRILSTNGQSFSI